MTETDGPIADLEPEEERRPLWSRWDWVALGGVAVVALILRFIRLGEPNDLVFDETYYAKDSCWYVNISETLCDTGSEITQVHPPLGKWLIAIGIRLFGYDSYGWRVSVAIVGTIGVVVLYLLARRLLKSTLGATIASGLLAIDLLHFVQSRTSMLDIFVPTFGIAAVLFVVYDRDRLLEGRVGGGGILDRPWRVAAGAAAGAATASKWTGGLYLLFVIVLTIVWEMAARREAAVANESQTDEARRPWLRFLREEAGSVGLWLFILPLVVYCFTYIGRLEWSEGTWYQALWDRHQYMLDFHTELTSHHSYESPAWSWIALKRPVSYFFCSGDDCDPNEEPEIYREIIATGNPFVWWPSVLALLYAAVRWLRRRSFRSPEGLIVGGFVCTYLPWVALQAFTGRSATFIFYILPAVPFMCLALAYVAVRIGKSWEAIAAISLFSAGTVVLFAFYYPLLTQAPIPKSDWDRRIWIFNNCDPGEGIETTTTITETIGKRTKVHPTVTKTTESVPPPGWCWI
jgi:dolichyl-phosphate-mannose--protein O-mannosyl transferase